MVGFAGVTVMDTSDADVTYNGVFPEIDPRVAVMVVVPIAVAVTNPLALMLAVGAGRGSPIGAGGAYQVTCEVISLLVPFE